MTMIIDYNFEVLQQCTLVRLKIVQYSMLWHLLVIQEDQKTYGAEKTTKKTE